MVRLLTDAGVMPRTTVGVQHEKQGGFTLPGVTNNALMQINAQLHLVQDHTGVTGTIEGIHDTPEACIVSTLQVYHASNYRQVCYHRRTAAPELRP